MKHETSYVIVAGIAWIRRSRVETRDGLVDDSVWVVQDFGQEVIRFDARTGGTAGRFQ